MKARVIMPRKDPLSFFPFVLENSCEVRFGDANDTLLSLSRVRRSHHFLLLVYRSYFTYLII
jgi:hypothetical protein